MKFDVVIGNPPYQMNDKGAFASSSPIYNEFVEQAKHIEPYTIAMIIPSRWFAGGKGLDEFRDEMLHDNRLKVIHDFPLAEDCFPGKRIAGGVCHFLWKRDYNGECDVYSHSKNKISSHMKRPLLEKGANTFIRINEAISILRKVQDFNEVSFANIVSARKPFGLASDFFNNPSKYNLPPISDEKIADGIEIIGTFQYKTTSKFVSTTYPFPSGDKYFNNYKVFVSQVLDNGFDWTKERLKPFLGYPNMACTETFLCVGCYSDKKIAENVISYMNTKFFHLLMFLKKVSHHVVAKVYEFIPLQDFTDNSDINWSKSIHEIDLQLYKKYGLDDDEINFIETNVKDRA